MNTFTSVELRSGPANGARRSPMPPGRRSGYSEETAGRLCEAIRRQGLSDAAAALTLGIPRTTLTRWKQQHPDLADWLEMAREQYRESKLAIVDEAKTADGRPDWHAAVWCLEKAFPEDYGRGSRRSRASDFPDPAPLLETIEAGRAAVRSLMEENEHLRAQLQALQK